MAGIETLILKENELPKILEVVGHSGERAFYMIKPAGRKFGACLQGVDQPLKDALIKQ